MKVSMNNDLQVGDVLYGVFRVRDARGNAPHYALVIGRRNGHAVALVGTSLKDDARSTKMGRDVFVVSPWSVNEAWADTGLVKATVFDPRNSTLVEIDERVIALAAPRKLGCVAKSLQAFARARSM